MKFYCHMITVIFILALRDLKIKSLSGTCSSAKSLPTTAAIIFILALRDLKIKSL